ncbi:unnamed protein product [Prorocentrum cordatum]|uniref:Uncharacterized protein n=1 Tax=Prorocentrum cordatum TaxID=2364126 RepID=A0ABN9REF5_9DINO|nr:unnamed protein product [Polarella glacialis]
MSRGQLLATDPFLTATGLPLSVGLLLSPPTVPSVWYDSSSHTFCAAAVFFASERRHANAGALKLFGGPISGAVSHGCEGPRGLSPDAMGPPPKLGHGQRLRGAMRIVGAHWKTSAEEPGRRRSEGAPRPQGMREAAGQGPALEPAGGRLARPPLARAGARQRLVAGVRSDSLWDGETPEFWNLCRACTSSRRVFCFTTGECLDLDIDAPSDVLWGACMNPLLIPDSCRTKGIHPPGTPREVMENWDRDL